MLTHTQNLQLALDVVGVFVFALSGGLVAVLDAAGLAAFAITGTLKALGAGAPATAAILNTATIWGGVATVFSARIIAVILGLNAPAALRTPTSTP